MRGFLEGLADHGVDQRLAGLEMAGRLVEPQAGRGVFLDQQETSVALDQRGHRDVRGPEFGFHGRAFYRLPRRAAEPRAAAGRRSVPMAARRLPATRVRHRCLPVSVASRRAWTIRHGLSTRKGPDLGAPGAFGYIGAWNLPLPSSRSSLPWLALPSKPRIRTQAGGITMLIGVPAETRANEARVAATPETVKKYVAAGHSVCVERGAGVAASSPTRPMSRPAPRSASVLRPMPPRSC